MHGHTGLRGHMRRVGARTHVRGTSGSRARGARADRGDHGSRAADLTPARDRVVFIPLGRAGTTRATGAIDLTPGTGSPRVIQVSDIPE